MHMKQWIQQQYAFLQLKHVSATFNSHCNIESDLLAVHPYSMANGIHIRHLPSTSYYVGKT